MNFDRRLLMQVLRHPALGILVICLGPATGLMILLQANYLARIVQGVFLDGASINDVGKLLAGLLAIFLLRGCANWLGDYSGSTLSRKIRSSLRGTLFQHLLNLGPRNAASEETGELTGLVVEGIDNLEAYYSQYLPGLVMAVLIPVTVWVFIFPIDILTAIILLFTAPLIPLFMLLIGNNAQSLTRKRWQNLSRLKAYFLDVIQGLTTLKSLGRSQSQVKIIERAGERYRQITMGVLRVTFLSAFSLELIATLSTAVIAVEVGLRLLYGQLTFYEAFFILLLAPEFYQPLRVLGARFHAGMAGYSAAQQIFRILEQPHPQECWLTDNPVEFHPMDDPQAVQANSGQFSEIRLEDVCYGYEEGRSGLHGVSLCLRRGEKIALVGPSGAGKTTVASLLLRFIHPENGRIWVDGQRLEAIPPDNWRAMVSWVPQRPYIFPATVLENLLLARPSSSMEEVIQAAHWAHAHDFIRDLPQGFETRLGERGTRLSAGQVQRIAIARAFLKNTPIIVLDEATASLDPENESLIQESLATLLNDRTGVIIAHRLNTITRADKIIVLEAGRVVQEGKHSELIQETGLYQKLVFSAQNPDDDDSQVVELPLEWNRNSPQSHEGSIGNVFDLNSTTKIPFKRHIPVPASGLFLWLLQWIKPSAAWLLTSALIGFLAIASSMGLMFASAYIISAAALHPSIAALQVAIVGVRFFGLARGVFRYLERTSSHEVAFRLLAALRVRFFQALEPLSPARLNRFRSGDLFSRITGDIESLEGFYVRGLSPPVTALLVGLASFSFLATFSPFLGMTLLVGYLAAGIGLPLAASMLAKNASSQEIRHLAELNAVVVESIQGMPELTAFGQIESRKDLVANQCREMDGCRAKLDAINAVHTALSGFLSHFCVWVMLAILIPLIRNGAIDGVLMASLALATLASFEAVLPLPQAARQLKGHLEAAGRLYEVVDARPEILDPAEMLQAPENPRLEIRNLSFRYPALLDDPDQIQEEDESTLPWVLDDINFSLQPGKRLGIVGPSGAGKSTLIYLLMRFWESRAGQILMEGSDVRTFSQESIRSKLAAVMQNPYLFSASLRENLLLACPAATQEQIENAARKACLQEFVQSLPQGYETWVGEQGVRLSAGELQRVAIARAFLSPAPIMILDEPTNHLDALNERKVLASIFDESNQRSILMILHRLVAMCKFDEILVLKDGRVVERGNHSELLKEGGLYRRMWDMQRERVSG